MTKKLIALISREGKSPEEIKKEARDTVAYHFAFELGLEKCAACGEYKGESLANGKKIRVRCICDGILCTSCKKVKIHRPISNFFSKDDLKILHVPYFSHFCEECKPTIYI